MGLFEIMCVKLKNCTATGRKEQAGLYDRMEYNVQKRACHCRALQHGKAEQYAVGQGKAKEMKPKLPFFVKQII